MFRGDHLVSVIFLRKIYALGLKSWNLAYLRYQNIWMFNIQVAQDCTMFSFLPLKHNFLWIHGGTGERKYPNHSAIFIHNKSLKFLKHKKEKRINREVGMFLVESSWRNAYTALKLFILGLITIFISHNRNIIDRLSTLDILAFFWNHFEIL